MSLSLSVSLSVSVSVSGEEQVGVVCACQALGRLALEVCESYGRLHSRDRTGDGDRDAPRGGRGAEGGTAQAREVSEGNNGEDESGAERDEILRYCH